MRSVLSERGRPGRPAALWPPLHGGQGSCPSPWSTGIGPWSFLELQLQWPSILPGFPSRQRNATSLPHTAQGGGEGDQEAGLSSEPPPRASCQQFLRPLHVPKCWSPSTWPAGVS